jgi:hypothetical protein
MCQDNSVTFLQSIGYNVVRLPREGIEPLLLLGGGNNLNILGFISDIMLEEPAPLPQIDADLQAANIEGLKSSQFEVGIGVKFLEKLLSAMGAGSVSLEAVYKKANQVEFQYQNVKNDRIFPLSVARYIRVAKPDVTSLVMDEILDMTRENPAYLIIETLKSTSFGVTAYDSTDAKVGIDLGALKELLDIHPNLQVSINDKLTVSYQGDKELRFAFKAVPLWIEFRGGIPIIKMSPPRPVGLLNFTAISPDLDNPELPTTVLIGDPSRLLKVRDK